MRRTFSDAINIVIALSVSASVVLFSDVLAVQAQVSRSQTSNAQTNRDTKREAVATNVRVELSPSGYSGSLYATINGRERKIVETVVGAWSIQGGRKIVYSNRDGAGGYENEGMSLYVYDVGTGKQRKVMSEYYMVDKVTEATTSLGKTALLVEMSDGGLGASYTAIVDPNRGEVFFRRFTKILSHAGDRVVLGHYTENDWSEMVENNNTSIKPRRTERINLNAVLRRGVIVNKPDR